MVGFRRNKKLCFLFWYFSLNKHVWNHFVIRLSLQGEITIFVLSFADFRSPNQKRNNKEKRNMKAPHPICHLRQLFRVLHFLRKLPTETYVTFFKGFFAQIYIFFYKKKFVSSYFFFLSMASEALRPHQKRAWEKKVRSKKKLKIFFSIFAFDFFKCARGWRRPVKEI